jgi:hypothetical protein
MEQCKAGIGIDNPRVLWVCRLGVAAGQKAENNDENGQNEGRGREAQRLIFFRFLSILMLN